MPEIYWHHFWSSAEKNHTCSRTPVFKWIMPKSVTDFCLVYRCLSLT